MPPQSPVATLATRAPHSPVTTAEDWMMMRGLDVAGWSAQRKSQVRSEGRASDGENTSEKAKEHVAATKLPPCRCSTSPNCKTEGLVGSFSPEHKSVSGSGPYVSDSVSSECTPPADWVMMRGKSVNSVAMSPIRLVTHLKECQPRVSGETDDGDKGSVSASKERGDAGDLKLLPYGSSRKEKMGETGPTTPPPHVVYHQRESFDCSHEKTSSSNAKYQNENAVGIITMEQAWRRKTAHLKYSETHTDIIALQSHCRKHQRQNEYRCCKHGILLLQAAVRGVLTRAEIDLWVEYHSSATLIQTMWRCKRDHVGFDRSQISVQFLYRRYLFEFECRSFTSGVRQLQGGLVLFQAIVRGALARDRIALWLRYHAAATQIQRMWCEKKSETDEDGEVESSITAFQSLYRRHRSMVDYERGRRGFVLLQAVVRGMLVREQTARWMHFHTSATQIQRKWRSKRAEAPQDAAEDSTITFQALYRRHRCRVEYVHCRNGVVKFQAAVRGFLGRKRDPSHFDKRDSEESSHKNSTEAYSMSTAPLGEAWNDSIACEPTVSALQGSGHQQANDKLSIMCQLSQQQKGASESGVGDEGTLTEQVTDNTKDEHPEGVQTDRGEAAAKNKQLAMNNSKHSIMAEAERAQLRARHFKDVMIAEASTTAAIVTDSEEEASVAESGGVEVAEDKPAISKSSGASSERKNVGSGQLLSEHSSEESRKDTSIAAIAAMSPRVVTAAELSIPDNSEAEKHGPPYSSAVSQGATSPEGYSAAPAAPITDPTATEAGDFFHREGSHSEHSATASSDPSLSNLSSHFSDGCPRGTKPLKHGGWETKALESDNHMSASVARKESRLEKTSPGRKEEEGREHWGAVSAVSSDDGDEDASRDRDRGLSGAARQKSKKILAGYKTGYSSMKKGSKSLAKQMKKKMYKKLR